MMLASHGQTTEDLPRANAPPTAPAAAGATAPIGSSAPLPERFKNDADGTIYNNGGKRWIKQGDQLVIENGG